MRFLIVIFSLWFELLSAKPLKFEKIQHSQITLSPDTVGVLPLGKTVYETPYFDKYIVESSYKPHPGPKEYPFGDRDSDTAGAYRHPFPKDIKKGYWHWLAPFGQTQLIMLEARKKKVAIFNRKQKEISGKLRYYFRSIQTGCR